MKNLNTLMTKLIVLKYSQLKITISQLSESRQVLQMNFSIGFNPASFNESPQEPDPSYDFSTVRKNMAFDYCFKSLYPKLTNEESMRQCIMEYKEYCKLTEKLFTQVVK